VAANAECHRVPPRNLTLSLIDPLESERGEWVGHTLQKMRREERGRRAPSSDLAFGDRHAKKLFSGH
jgi:hypothetical protein